MAGAMEWLAVTLIPSAISITRPRVRDRICDVIFAVVTAAASEYFPSNGSPNQLFDACIRIPPLLTKKKIRSIVIVLVTINQSLVSFPSPTRTQGRSKDLQHSQEALHLETYNIQNNNALHQATVLC